MSLLWTALVMGLMGGFHCIGMCGPIALALPSVNNQKRRQFVKGRVAYNLGRVVTYSGLGLFFGIFGLTMNLAGMQQFIAILSGTLILVLQYFPGNLSGKISNALKVPVLVRSLKNSFAFYFQKKGTSSLFILGLLNGLLPCGFVYLALAGSLTTGSVIGAAQYMMLFGLGTMPIMLSLSLTGRVILPKYRFKVQKAVPYITTIIALLFILRGLSLGIPYLSPDLKPDNSSHSPTEMSTCH
jgi:uncharacterized protein